MQLHSFLSTALVGSGWLTSCSRRCPFGRKPPQPLNKLDGPKSRFGRLREEKSVTLAEIRNPDGPASSLVAIPTSLSWLLSRKLDVSERFNHSNR